LFVKIIFNVFYLYVDKSQRLENIYISNSPIKIIGVKFNSSGV